MGAPFTFPVAEAVPFDGTEATPTPFVAENVKDGIIEARNSAPGKARVTIPCIHNGTLSNGFWIGYSELVSSDTTPIVIPWNSRLKEVSFSANRNSMDGQMDFYVNGTSVGDIVYSESFVNVNRVKVFLPDFALSANDLLRMRWVDNGQNPRDMALMLFFILTD
jgi:hypothetical protein